MNLKEIKEMINLMNENNLTELEMERDGLKIRLKKAGTGEIVREIETIATPTRASQEGAGNIVEIKAPMVGTFYRAPSPTSDPFVKAQDEIEEDQTICIIEAMKLMNEIKAGLRGKILDVLVENGEAVEFDQPLFKVEIM